jgi:serine/threonine-protein kinase
MTMTITQPFFPSPVGGSLQGDQAYLTRYQTLVGSPRIGWNTGCHKVRLLGRGGQGVVFLCERRGAQGFTLPVALKVFTPEPYRDADSYRHDMARVAQVAGRVALIQHDHVLDIHDFIEQDGIGLMEMEWLDGHDLCQLLSPWMLERTRARLSAEHWAYVNNVIATAGPQQPRLKPGVAIKLLRDCLAALAALHREAIVHGDLKPANILLKRTGHAKVIDIGSAIDLQSPSARRLWSPAYAAPEVLEGAATSPRADLASLGYVLVEMLAGRSPFGSLTTIGELIAAKKGLEQRLPALLPPEVSCNELLLHLCRRLVAADPGRRFGSAQAADLDPDGAAAFHRQLVKGDLSSEYENDIRVWLQHLP